MVEWSICWSVCSDSAGGQLRVTLGIKSTTGRNNIRTDCEPRSLLSILSNTRFLSTTTQVEVGFNLKQSQQYYSSYSIFFPQIARSDAEQLLSYSDSPKFAAYLHSLTFSNYYLDFSAIFSTQSLKIGFFTPRTFSWDHHLSVL
jgi:hypothetical protein